MEIPFVGGAYTGKSTSANAQECVNLFPVIDNREGKVSVMLHSTPGLVLFSTLVTETTSTVNRGSHAFGSVMYTVVEDTVYSVATDGTRTSKGTITTSTGNVFFADNGTEVILVDGTNAGYLITAGSLAAITDGDFPVAKSVTFQDGYFIITSNNGRIYISGLYDGTSWDTLDYGTAEANPDDAEVVLSANRDLWIFGTKTSEVFSNSGNSDFPYIRIPGAVIELGIGAPGSAVAIDGVIYWFSSNNRVLRTNGYGYRVVSTIHLDYQVSTYSTVSDARAYKYELYGHIFYVLNFPTAKKTWVYDITTDYWHEWRSHVDGLDVPWGRHRGNSCTKFNGQYVIGDYINGLLYTLDSAVYTDNLNPIQRIRTGQIINKEKRNVIWHRVEIDFEVGVGLSGGEIGGEQGEDPEVALTWSDDGGRTYSNEHWKKLGRIGEYTTKVVWKRLGISRNRILRITISDPVKVIILGAYAELEECDA